MGSTSGMFAACGSDPGFSIEAYESLTRRAARSAGLFYRVNEAAISRTASTLVLICPASESE